MELKEIESTIGKLLKIIASSGKKNKMRIWLDFQYAV